MRLEMRPRACGKGICTIRSERQSVRLRRRRCFSGNTLVPKRKIRRVTKGKEGKKRGWGQNPTVHQSQGEGGAKTRIKVNEGLYRKKFLEILSLL